MKKQTAILSLQRNIGFAGFGGYFAAAFFLGLGSIRFQPLVNEFQTVLQLALAIAVFVAGTFSAPGRKSGHPFLRQSAFLLLLYSFPFFALRHPDWRLIFFSLFLAAGWISGQLAGKTISSLFFYLSGLSGAAAGMLFSWGITVHAGTEMQQHLFIAAIFILELIALRLSAALKTPAAGKAVLLLLWFLWGPAVIMGLWAENRNHSGQPGGEENELQPAMVVQSGLQPNRNGLKILLLSDDLKLLRNLNSFPLTWKFSTLSLRDGTDIYRRLNAETDHFDLIVLQAPLPDSLYAERFHSVRFYQLLKDRLSPDGVLAVWLPEEIMTFRKTRTFELYGTVGAGLGQVFPNVKPAGGEALILLCGGNNITNSPEELNRRAKELLATSRDLPDGAFLMMNTPEERAEQERLFRSESVKASVRGREMNRNSLVWNSIRSKPLLDRTALGKIVDYLQGKCLNFLIALTVVLLILRYLFSGGTENKRACLAMENGLYTGLLTILFMIPYQQLTGRLSRDWSLLAGIFLLTAFCGMLASAGKHHSPPLLKLLLGLTLLLPLCGLACFYGYTSEPLFFYAAVGYAGYTGGAICGDLRADLPVVLTGFVLGLALGSVLSWVPGGMVFAAVLAILMRIPPIAAENLQKQFDKRKKTYNI